MALKRMDNVSIVVEDLDAVIAFFVEIGMKSDGTSLIEGSWAARVVGLDEQRAEVAMLRAPDGHGGIELIKYLTPEPVRGVPHDAPSNTLGYRRVMFEVDDINGTIARLRTHGAELVGEVAQFENVFLLCYVRGPEGIVVGLAERIG